MLTLLFCSLFYVFQGKINSARVKLASTRETHTRSIVTFYRRESACGYCQTEKATKHRAMSEGTIRVLSSILNRLGLHTPSFCELFSLLSLSECKFNLPETFVQHNFTSLKFTPIDIPIRDRVVLRCVRTYLIQTGSYLRLRHTMTMYAIYTNSGSPNAHTKVA